MSKETYECPPQQRPSRPFGVSLAIIMSVVFFSILPLAELLAVLFISRTMVIEEGGAGFSGVNIAGLANPLLILQTLLALTFLAIAILAWRGRPAFIRVVFWVTVMLVSAILIVSQVYSWLNAGLDISMGFDSVTQLEAQTQITYTITIGLLSIYITWFMNRWSARAFYRGHYLPSDLERIAESQM